MCGRYGFVPKADFSERFEIQNSHELKLESSYNLSPGTINPIIVANSPKKVIFAKWGLIPHWAKDPKIAYSTINARSEEIEIKPVFKESFKNKRCLVPASFYFEFATLKSDPKVKVPYLFKLKGTDEFAMAGLYSVWRDVEDHEICTYSIITTQANDLGAKIHSRMPAILSENDWDEWEDNSQCDVKSLKSLLRPFTGKHMEYWPVSRNLNNARNDSADLIKPVTPEPVNPSRPAWEQAT